jgi:PAS domain S-box-containing protein
MTGHSDQDKIRLLRQKIIGLGEKSISKSYYPELRKQLDQLETQKKNLEEQNLRLQSFMKELENERRKTDASEAKYRSVIENIQDVFYRSDARGNLIMASPSFLTLLGYESLDDCLDKPIAETLYYYPEKRAEFLRQIKEHGNVTDYEVILKRKDGSPVIVETSSHLYFNDAGDVAGVEGVFRDITMRRRAEEALTASEHQLKAIVDGSPIPQFVIDGNHHIIHWNRALEEYSGFKSDDIIGTNQQWRAFYTYERPCMSDLLVDGLIDKVPLWYAGKYCRSRLIKDAFEAIDFFPDMKGGTWLSFTAAPLRNENGIIIGAVETLIDITDQKHAEEALRLNAERSETLLKINQMTDTPLNEIIGYAFEEAVRFTRSEIGYLGLMNDDETDMDVQVWSRNVMPECILDNKSVHFPLKNAGLWGEAIRQRKAIITNDYNVNSPLKKGYPEGHLTIKRHMNIPIIVRSKIVLVAGVGNKADDYDETDIQQLTLLMEGIWRIIERRRDLEDRKKLEEKLIQAQKMEAVGRLAGGVAHDFNNMLTPILGYAELLKRGLPQDDPRQNKLNEIIRASERSRDLVRQLLAFARKQTLEMNLVDLNRVIKGFENMLRRTLHENINLEICLIPFPGSIMADIGQIEQIVLNLAVNAQDAMPEGGALFISTSVTKLDDAYAMSHEEVKAGLYATLVISDTGEGIDPETCKRIFEPFFTTKGVMGTGLGLATVYGIVKQHGGHITIYSESGKGTTFRVYFPLHIESAVPAEIVRELDTQLNGNETLMVVEDQEQVRTLAVDILKDSGYRVLEAIDIKTAIETADSHQGDIHLLITDVILPDGNGKELYESICVGRSGIKVLYMSGYPSNVIMHHGVLEPSVQFIHKPFSIVDFTKKIREVLL